MKIGRKFSLNGGRPLNKEFRNDTLFLKRREAESFYMRDRNRCKIKKPKTHWLQQR